jgi:hypothetical protein
MASLHEGGAASLDAGEVASIGAGERATVPPSSSLGSLANWRQALSHDLAGNPSLPS